MKSVWSRRRLGQQSARYSSRRCGPGCGFRWRFAVSLFFFRHSKCGGCCRRASVSLLGLFGGALVLSLLPLVLWKRPTREKSLARIEQVSALEHRPLTAYNDTISHEAASPETAALWQAHRDRAAQSLDKLKSGPARPRVDRYDPFALRALLVLMLVAVTVWASTDLPGRLEAAFKVRESRPPRPTSASTPGSLRRPTPGKSNLCSPTRQA